MGISCVWDRNGVLNDFKLVEGRFSLSSVS